MGAERGVAEEETGKVVGVFSGVRGLGLSENGAERGSGVRSCVRK